MSMLKSGCCAVRRRLVAECNGGIIENVNSSRFIPRDNPEEPSVILIGIASEWESLFSNLEG